MSNRSSAVVHGVIACLGVLERLTKLGPVPDGWILGPAHGEATRSRRAMGSRPPVASSPATEAARRASPGR